MLGENDRERKTPDQNHRLIILVILIVLKGFKSFTNVVIFCYQLDLSGPGNSIRVMVRPSCL